MKSGGVSGSYFTDSRDGKRYKAVKIGKQILQWKDEKDLAKQLEEWIKYLFSD